jgi:hypothetical protein
LLEGAPLLQTHFVNAHGLLAVLEVLEARPSREVILLLLRIINTVSHLFHGPVSLDCA